jgi:hypothetical protein
MSFAYANFIAAFPEFSNATQFPQPTFAFWQTIANERLNVRRWGALLDTGAMIFNANNRARAATRATAAAVGGIPGANEGPLTAKSVDKVSMSFDANAATIEGAGNYNLTTYGTQFYELMLIVGSGGQQFG